MSFLLHYILPFIKYKKVSSENLWSYSHISPNNFRKIFGVIRGPGPPYVLACWYMDGLKLSSKLVNFGSSLLAGLV